MAGNNVNSQDSNDPRSGKAHTPNRAEGHLDPDITRRSNHNERAEDSAARAYRYTSYISEHANRGQERYLFSGSHYRGLSHMLSFQAITIAESSPPFNHVITRDFRSSDAEIATFDASSGFESFAQMSDPNPQTARLVFIRGYSSPEWICLLGSQYRIDIEYIRQQLPFLEDKDFYDLPPLPSNSQNILRLSIPTIWKRDTAISLPDIQRLRQFETMAVRKYQQSLNTIGQSIIRNFSIHDETTFTVEQDILIHLVNKKGRGWTAIIWLDAGRELPQSNEAPWQGLHSKWQNPRNDCIPTVKHVPAKILSSMRNLSHVQDPSSHDSLPPSASCLPQQYGLTLDSQTASVDPLYALSELFFFSASNESQFLNMIGSRITEIMGKYKGEETHALDNLNYSIQLVRDHMQRIEDIRIFLECEVGRQWPLPNTRPQKALHAQALLVDDFTYLARRAQDLSAQTLEGMNLISNRVMLEESRRAIATADRMHRLTLLAFFFLPLSFTTSLFGTNFRQFGTGTLSIWVLFITLVPVTMVATVICFWNKISTVDWKKMFRFEPVK